MDFLVTSFFYVFAFLRSSRVRNFWDQTKNELSPSVHRSAILFIKWIKAFDKRNIYCIIYIYVICMYIFRCEIKELYSNLCHIFRSNNFDQFFFFLETHFLFFFWLFNFNNFFLLNFVKCPLKTRLYLCHTEYGGLCYFFFSPWSPNIHKSWKFYSNTPLKGILASDSMRNSPDFTGKFMRINGIRKKNLVQNLHSKLLPHVTCSHRLGYIYFSVSERCIRHFVESGRHQ